jgi:transcriptional regulator with XRE-family HTH domain
MAGFDDKNQKDQKRRVERYLEGIARYLSTYRKREGLTQNELAIRLDISLNRYREYEQNTTDNAKGIPLDLMLRIAALEGNRPQDFVARLEGDDLADGENIQIDTFEEKLLREFRTVALAERRKFLESFEFEDETDKLIPSQMRWFVRIYNQLVRLPYASRMRIEREVLEAYIAGAQIEVGSEEHSNLLARLKVLLRYYFANFGDTERGT